MGEVINGKSDALWINGRQVLAERVASGTWTKIGTWTLPDFNINGSSLVTQLGLKAPLASPTFTGTVTLPAVTLGGAVAISGQVFDAGSGNAQINTTGLASGLIVQSTQDGGAGSLLQLKQISASPAATDQLALFQATGQSDGSPQNTINYGTLYFNITSPTKGAETGDMNIYLYNSGANNEALRLTGPGVLSVDLAGSGAAAQVDLFDGYDDAIVLRQGIQQNNRELLADMGVVERKNNGSGYMMKVQPMIRLLAGGIYQGRQQLDDLRDELHKRLALVEKKLALLN